MTKILSNIGYGFKGISLEIQLEFNHKIKLKDTFLSAIFNVCLYTFNFSGIDYLTYNFMTPKDSALNIEIQGAVKPSIEWMKLYYEIRKYMLRYIPKRIEGLVQLSKGENIHLINNLWSLPTLGYNGNLSELEDFKSEFLDDVGLYRLLSKTYCKLYSKEREKVPILYFTPTKLEFLEEIHTSFLRGNLEEVYPIVPIPIKYLKHNYRLINKSKNDIIISSIIYKDLNLLNLINKSDLETNILIEKVKRNLDSLHKDIINRNIYVTLHSYNSTDLICKYVDVDLYEIFSKVA